MRQKPFPTNFAFAHRAFATGAALSLLMACAGVPSGRGPATVAGVQVPAPLAAGGVKDSHFGVEVQDPYRFLEDVKDPQVQQWMRAQADATTSILAKLPGRAGLLERIKTIEASAGGQVSTITETDGGRIFFMRRNPGENQFKLVWRQGYAGTDTVIFDPEKASAPGQPRAIMDFAPSRDGRKLAYAMQVGGGEIGTLHVMDVGSGMDLIQPIDRIRYSGVSWLDDGRGFFYSRLIEGYEKLPTDKRFSDRTRHFRALDAQGTDRPVLSPSRNPELKLPIYASARVGALHGLPIAVATVSMGVERNVMLLRAPLQAAIEGKAAWQTLLTTADEVSALTAKGDTFYLRSSKGAPRYRILRMVAGADGAAKTEVVVPEGEGVIGQLAAAADALYFTRREGVNTTLLRLPYGGRVPEPVALPVVGEVEIRDHDQSRAGITVSLAGWTRATKLYRVDPATHGLTKLALAQDGAFDAPGDIESREVMVKSHDGTMVPLSIVSKKGMALDGRNPTILYGYGAYGSTEDPFLNPRIYAWIERGGIFATVHVRGGGVFGKAWHDGGRKGTKPNTWKDAIAAGEWLVAQGYTGRERMAVWGGSAGGILVGRAITERPDLFAAAVPSVGVMDALRTESTANGAANIPEFGSVKIEDEFKALLAMSSYHHVRDGVKYPAVMATHGVNDIRVDVWQSAKFASRLASATASGKPVLMRLEYDSGHGQGSTRAQAQERSTDIFSFLLWQFGAAEFQPRN